MKHPTGNAPIVGDHTKKETSKKESPDLKQPSDNCEKIVKKFNDSLTEVKDAVPQKFTRKEPRKSKAGKDDEVFRLPPWGKE